MSMDDDGQSNANARSNSPEWQELQELPIGYRFTPKDEEVVYYLKKKVLGAPIPAVASIQDIDAAEFYSKHPAELVAYRDEKEWLFFVHLNENYLNERRRSDRVITNKKRHTWRAYGDDEHVENIDGDGFALKTTWKLLKASSISIKETNWKIEEFWMPPDSIVDRKVEECALSKLIMGRGLEDLNRIS